MLVPCHNRAQPHKVTRMVGLAVQPSHAVVAEVAEHRSRI